MPLRCCDHWQPYRRYRIEGCSSRGCCHLAVPSQEDQGLVHTCRRLRAESAISGCGWKLLSSNGQGHSSAAEHLLCMQKVLENKGALGKGFCLFSLPAALVFYLLSVWGLFCLVPRGAFKNAILCLPSKWVQSILPPWSQFLLLLHADPFLVSWPASCPPMIFF